MINSLSFYTLNIKIPETSPFGTFNNKQGKQLHFIHSHRVPKHPHSNKQCCQDSPPAAAVQLSNFIMCTNRLFLWKSPFKAHKFRTKQKVTEVKIIFVFHETRAVNLWRLFSWTGFSIYMSETIHFKIYQTKPWLVLIWII